MSTLNIRIFAVLLTSLLTGPVQARQSFLDQWRQIYPNSDSSRRECQLCHINAGGDQPWNGYGFDIRARFIELNRLDMRTAIVDTEQQDSDSDEVGLTNIQEIQQGFDPGWRAPGLNFGLFSDMSFIQVSSPFSDTDGANDEVCFVVPNDQVKSVAVICF